MSNEKEIIIDGVDVAGCEHHLSTGYCQLQMIFQGMVLQLPFGKHLECNLCDKDCYYKQLKRLQQDYVTLGKAFEHLKTSYQDNCEYILQLNDENARLKNERTADLVKQIDELKAENEMLKKEINKIRENKCTDCIQHLITKSHKLALERANKVFRTLQEIKAIANNIVYSDEIPACVNDKECPLNGGDGFDNHCNMRCPFILGKQILDLITKAEEE